MKEDKNEDLLNEIINIGKENILDLDLNSTKFGDIINNINTKNVPTDKKKIHQKCTTSISNEEFTEQIMKEINTGGLDEIYEILEQDNDESAKKIHSRNNTETLDYFRFSNYNKNNNIKGFQMDNRKTMVVDNYDIHQENIDESDSEDENDQNNQINNEDDDNEVKLSNILGMQLEKFNKENDGIILDDENKGLINDLKNDDIKKYVKTGTKIDFVEDMEGNFFMGYNKYKDLEKYISQLDSQKNQNEMGQNKKTSKKIHYDIITTYDNSKLYKDLENSKIQIFSFDINKNIYCSTEKGNVLIYNLDEGKKVKELDNPFKEEKNKNKSIYTITAMNVDEKYIVSAYSNGRVAIFRKGKDKLNKTKFFMTTAEIIPKTLINEIKVYSGKKDRIILYLVFQNGKILRFKIYKNYFFNIKGKHKQKPIFIESENNQFYNFEINPFYYKCIGICNSTSIFIYNIKKKENILLYSKIQNINNNYYPSFCFINSFNKKEKSKFMVSTNPDSVIIYEINSNFTSFFEIKKYMFKDPIIKLGAFNNETVYIFDKANQISLINSNQNSIKIKRKINDNLNLSDKKNFAFERKELYLYNNIISNRNRNILINSKNKILLITPITLEKSINKIFEKKDNEKYSTFFTLCQQVYKEIHPIWNKSNYQECSNLIMEKIDVCINEINANFTNLNDKMEKLKNFVDFLFNVELYDYITSEKDGLFSKLKDNKLYFYLLEPFILQNKMKNISLPIIFINRLIDFYVNINKKSWLCELLIHFDIKLLCDKNMKNKNGISLIDIFDKKNLINLIIYLRIIKNDFFKDDSYYSPIIDILLNLIKESKNIKKGELSNKFLEIISCHIQYNEMKDYNYIINKEDEKQNEFLDLNRYNDELLFSNYYLRLKILWYIYTVLFVQGIDDNNKKKCQELIDKSLEVIFTPKIYEILEVNNENKESLNLDGEIRFFINKLFKDENINEFCEIDKEEILHKIEKLVKKNYLSQIAYYLICLKSYLDDSTLEINKETKLNMLLFFMNNYNNNKYDKYKIIKTEQFENDLIELLKHIDSFTFEDSEKIIKVSNSCKDCYPKLHEYIVNNFKNN